MKKNILIFATIISLFISSVAFSQSASLPDVTASPGDDISIPLTVDNMVDLEGMDIIITFDEGVIDAMGATLTGGVLENENYSIQVNTGVDGQITLIIYANADLYTGSGVVAYFEFHVVGIAPSYTDLTFTQFDINEVSYLDNVTNGSVTIPDGDEPSAFLPDVTVSPGDDISIPLTVDNMVDLEGMDIIITFDEGVIDAMGATLTGGVLENENYSIQVNTGVDGQITLIIYANADLYTGSGVVAYFEFHVVGIAPSYTDLTFTQFDINEVSYLDNVTNGSVTIPDGDEPWATLPDTTAGPETDISIPLTVDNMVALEGMDITITFDESVLDSADATLTGGVLENENYSLQVNPNTPGEIVLIIYANADLYSGSGIVVYLDFHVVGNCGDSTPLTFTQFDVNEISYLDNVTNGSVVILSPPQNLEAEVIGDTVSLTWEVPECTALVLNYYKVYRDDFTIAVIYNSTVYQDPNLEYGTYTYYVTAVYDEGESVPSNTVEVTIPDGGIDDEIISYNDIFLKQNFPNPFSKNTTISYYTSTSTNVKLQIYNVKGELITTLFDEDKPAGYHTVEWNVPEILASGGTGMSSGIYFYKLSTEEDKTFIKKMILMR